MFNFKITLPVFLLFSMSFHLSAQTVLLHESINDYDFRMPKEGPNFRHFHHFNLGYAFFIPSDDPYEIQIKNGTSTIFTLGWRYKYKLTNWLAIGAGINYFNEVYNLKQNENKIVPDTVLHKTEKFKFNNLGPDVYIRFNFGKRGNIIGRFLDLGAYLSWTASVKHVYEDKIDPASSAGRAGIERTIYSKLNYMEKFHYGLKARIGTNRFVLTGTYRLNDLFTDDYKSEVGNYTLPQLAIGLEIGLHK